MNEERVALILTLLIRRCPECPQLEVKDASSKLYGIAGKGPRAVVWLGFRETELRGDGLRGDGVVHARAERACPAAVCWTDTGLRDRSVLMLCTHHFPSFTSVFRKMRSKSSDCRFSS